MIAPYIKETMNSKGASVIRKMFEEGIQLKKQFGQDKVFDFSLGNPDLDPPEKVVEAVRKIADDVSHGRHGYMQNAGYSETRSAMAQKVSGEQKVTLCAENIVMTCGAASALNCVLKAVISPGDEVIVPAPFFAEYRHYVNNFSGRLVEVPSNDDFSLNIEKIKSSLSEKTAAIIINTPTLQGKFTENLKLNLFAESFQNTVKRQAVFLILSAMNLTGQLFTIMQKYLLFSVYIPKALLFLVLQKIFLFQAKE